MPEINYLTCYRCGVKFQVIYPHTRKDCDEQIAAKAARAEAEKKAPYPPFPAI